MPECPHGDPLADGRTTPGETRRGRAWGTMAMDDFCNSDGVAVSRLNLMRSCAGDNAWPFEEAELESDRHEKFDRERNSLAAEEHAGFPLNSPWTITNAGGVPPRIPARHASNQSGIA